MPHGPLAAIVRAAGPGIAAAAAGAPASRGMAAARASSLVRIKTSGRSGRLLPVCGRPCGPATDAEKALPAAHRLFTQGTPTGQGRPSGPRPAARSARCPARPAGPRAARSDLEDELVEPRVVHRVEAVFALVGAPAVFHPPLARGPVEHVHSGKEH